jgi:hypothetical protein
MKLLEMKKIGCALVAAAGLLAAPSGGALAQGVKNSVNLAVASLPGVAGTTANMGMLEYERLVLDKLSVFGRASSLKYKWDDGNDFEDGKGTGVGVGTRFYPQGGLKGFYIGAAIAAFNSTWDWTDDKGRASEKRGDGESSAIQWGGELGYRFNLGSDRVSLTPAFNFGSWLGGDDKCRQTFPTNTTCSKGSELGFYAVISVALGIAF